MNNESIDDLIAFFGNYRKAAEALEAETGYSMAVSTIGRIAKGEAKPAVAALVCYALTNAKAKQNDDC